MIHHLIEIDKGLIERGSSNPKTTVEIKTYNEVVEVNYVCEKYVKK